MPRYAPVCHTCYCRYLTKSSHLAGQDQDLIQAQYIKEQWENQGLDSVDILGYDVLLSYPEEDNPSTVSLLDDSGKV